MARPRKEQVTEDRRAQVLEAACLSILNRGLTHTNAQAIANDLKISQTAVFYYFPKQQQLFDNLFDYVVYSGRQYALKNPPPFGTKTNFDRLRSYLMGQLMWAVAAPHHLSVMILSISEAHRNIEVGSKVREALDHGESTVFSMIAAGIVDGEFEKPEEPRLLAKALHRLLMGSMIDICLRSAKSVDLYWPLLNPLLTQLQKKIDETTSNQFEAKP